METLHGIAREELTRGSLDTTLTIYARCHVDLGTGDGRFVRSVARAYPGCLVIGVDACREQLRDVSRRALANELYVIANVEALPVDLEGVASSVTINFPWGSLLDGLLHEQSSVLRRLVGIVQPHASLEVRLNAGALDEAGSTLAEGVVQVRRALAHAGFAMGRPVPLDARALRAFPSTWAKRLAFGRDPRAVYLAGRYTR